jgi:hypothetical protein
VIKGAGLGRTADWDDAGEEGDPSLADKI